MDPNACLSELLMAVSEQNVEEARELASALVAWLDAGGFVPGTMRKESIRSFCRWVLDEIVEQA